MDSEYPPLPRSVGLQSLASKPSIISERGERPAYHAGEHDSVDVRQTTKIISKCGDIIIVYSDQDNSQPADYRWQVASKDLIHNSPYFRALLDPNKFSEGRSVMEQRLSRRQVDNCVFIPSESIEPTLPTVSLPVEHFTQRLGINVIEIFLRILSLNSLSPTEKVDFEAELRLLPTSLVAKVVEIADAFNSPYPVRNALKDSRYAFGKGRPTLFRFDVSLLKMNEERIRQIILIANFLDEHAVFQVLTHTLIIAGSKFWTNGLKLSDPDAFRWRYLPDGLEEELYYRRQCVLNTITDLQAYFLRAYGALEGPEDLKQVLPNTVLGPNVILRHRQIQCRMAFGNSSACDTFHLGQMIRFFTLRTKTAFLGSSLIDPDFDSESSQSDADEDKISERSSQPPTDITAVIISLKAFPDYQIESSHTGCGVRRRIMPALDCIEKFLVDPRGLLGISLQCRQAASLVPTLTSISWSNRTLARTDVVDIRSSGINAIYSSTLHSKSSLVEEARLFFTAKRRNWES